MTIPTVITSSDAAWPAIAAGPLASFSSRRSQASPMSPIVSVTVMMARTGASSVPAWKAFWLSTKPIGPMTATA